MDQPTGFQSTTLYRMFDASGALLYIGVGTNPGRRFEQHRGDKPWWGDVANIKTEHYPSRSAALAAEAAAIRSEHPRYNIAMNLTPDGAPPPVTTRETDLWYFSYRRDGTERASDLHLDAELSCASCLDDLWQSDSNGPGQVLYYVNYIRRHHPEWWEADAVPVNWGVTGACIQEWAPFSPTPYLELGRRIDFLTYFTWPHDAYGNPIDWYALPVECDRFPSFAKALGWSPSPLQATAPIRSIMAARRDSYA